MLTRHQFPRVAFTAITLGLSAAVVTSVAVIAQARRDFDVTARQYSFEQAAFDVMLFHFHRFQLAAFENAFARPIERRA